MIRILTLFIFITAAHALRAAPEPPPPNQTYLKLMVVNEADEMLLVKFKGIWEPAGKSYRENLSLNEVVKLMGREIGVEVESPQLRALLSTFFNQHTKPTSFAYYTAEYKSGTPIVPEDCEEIGWFPLAEAGDKIDLEEMGLVARHVAAGKQNVLSGAVRVIKTSESRSIEIIEPFK